MSSALGPLGAWMCTMPPIPQVTKLEEIYGLKKYVPNLTFLDLSGNTLCEDKSYRCVGRCAVSSAFMAWNSVEAWVLTGQGAGVMCCRHQCTKEPALLCSLLFQPGPTLNLALPLCPSM